MLQESGVSIHWPHRAETMMRRERERRGQEREAPPEGGRDGEGPLDRYTVSLSGGLGGLGGLKAWASPAPLGEWWSTGGRSSF